ncbi:MAG: ABC transporter permease [Thermoplasmata archaeon]|nr:ABC transporter permease [Thermoplasmata archaeon]
MNIKKVIVDSAWIAWKDLLEFSRSRMRLFMLILMPLFMMGMVGFVFPSSSSINDVPVAIANLDTGWNNITMGNMFVMGLNEINNKTGMMKISYCKNFKDIKNKIEEGKINGGIIIPSDFSSSIMNGRQGNITIVTDPSIPQLSMQLEAVLSKIIDEMGTNAAMHRLNMTYNVSLNYSLAMVKPYHATVKTIINTKSNYFQFVAPGVMAMTIMTALMTGLPHAISYERDVGTLDGILVAPVRRWAIITGKVLSQTTRGMIQAFIVLLLAIFLFGVTIHGNILLVVFLLLLEVFSFVGLGILITSFADREETASMMMMTLMFPMMFLSGVFFPIQQMPWYMQYIAYALPLTYATTALRKAMIFGAGISIISTEVIIMLIFGAVMLSIAVPIFKEAMRK